MSNLQLQTTALIESAMDHGALRLINKLFEYDNAMKAEQRDELYRLQYILSTLEHLRYDLEDRV
jgi:hypothetical protein